MLYVIHFRLDNSLCLWNANFHRLVLFRLFWPHASVRIQWGSQRPNPSAKKVKSQINTRSATNSRSPISVLHFCLPELQGKDKNQPNKKQKPSNQTTKKTPTQLVKTSNAWEKAVIKIRSPSATFLFAGTCTLHIQSEMGRAFIPQITCIKMFSSSRTLVVFVFCSVWFLFPWVVSFTLLNPQVVQNHSEQRCLRVILFELFHLKDQIPVALTLLCINICCRGQQFRQKKWMEKTWTVNMNKCGGGMEKNKVFNNRIVIS